MGIYDDEVPGRIQSESDTRHIKLVGKVVPCDAPLRLNRSRFGGVEPMQVGIIGWKDIRIY